MDTPRPSPRTNRTRRVPLAGGEFDAQRGRLPDLSGNKRHAAVRGNARVLREAGHGAEQEVAALDGATDVSVVWPEYSVPSTFTICSVSRWTSTVRSKQARVLSGYKGGGTVNWLHGHYIKASGYGAGSALYGNGWKTRPNALVADDNDWVVLCGTNDASVRVPGNAVLDGEEVGGWQGGQGGASLHINDFSTQKSDFALHSVLVWEAGLSTSDMRSVTAALRRQLSGAGAVASSRRMQLAQTGAKLLRAGVRAQTQALSTFEPGLRKAYALRQCWSSDAAQARDPQVGCGYTNSDGLCYDAAGQRYCAAHADLDTRCVTSAANPLHPAVSAGGAGPPERAGEMSEVEQEVVDIPRTINFWCEKYYAPTTPALKARYLARCAAADCAQAADAEVGCRYKNPDGFCYLGEGQDHCENHPADPLCVVAPESPLHPRCLGAISSEGEPSRSRPPTPY